MHAAASRGVRCTQAGTARARTPHVHGYRTRPGAAQTGVVHTGADHAHAPHAAGHGELRTSTGTAHPPARRTRPRAPRYAPPCAPHAPAAHGRASRTRTHADTRVARPRAPHTATRSHGHPRVVQSAARHRPAHRAPTAARRPAHLHLLQRGAGRRWNKAERR